MTTMVAVLVTVLTSFFAPLGGAGMDSSIEGSERFGLIIDDPRDMTQEENQVTHWQYCP